MLYTEGNLSIITIVVDRQVLSLFLVIIHSLVSFQDSLWFSYCRIQNICCCVELAAMLAHWPYLCVLVDGLCEMHLYLFCVC